MITPDRGLHWKAPPEGWQSVGIVGASKVWSLMMELLTALGVETALTDCCSFRPVRLHLRPGRGSGATAHQCNPAFLEWLMGWPIGWTASGSPVTEFARWQQRMRTALSALP
jgi:hypothetical protein